MTDGRQGQVDDGVPPETPAGDPEHAAGADPTTGDAGGEPSDGSAIAAASGRLRPLLLLLIAVPLLFGLAQLGRQGGLGVTPDFDWSPYPVEVQEAVDRAAKNADCGGLAKQRAWALSDAAAGIDTAPLVERIDGIRQLLVCPPVR